jgi:TPR repeat protein
MYLSKTLTILMTVISISVFGQDSKIENAEMQATITQYNIGENFFFGKTVNKDTKKGIKFIEASANNGYGKAQLNMGKLYMRGYKVRKNLTKAFYWSSKAAEQNNSEAQYYLAVMYIKGRGVKKDIKKGILWMLKSKNQGYVKAEQQWNKLEKFHYNS